MLKRDDLLWYVSYGSNLYAQRFSYYLQGGTPPGTTRVYPGCRDKAAPLDMRPVWLPGGVFFSLESGVWTGGMAFYDSSLEGRAAGRAYLITAGQFADVAAQEMHRVPTVDLELGEAITLGRAVLGPGRYETVVCTGALEGVPLLTFTSPESMEEMGTAAPSAAYLRMLGRGLEEAHGWDAHRAAEYLSSLPGANGNWSSTAIAELLVG